MEHLKSVIKSCGMSVPPSIYKRVKQVPENKCEAQLIKELEDILSKEGLSANPSEKEVKDVRKRKERAKELEVIDTSNIVISSCRRPTTSFTPPPKPKIPDVSSDDESEESDEDDGDDDDEDAGDDGNSQSEESDEDEYKDLFACLLQQFIDYLYELSNMGHLELGKRSGCDWCMCSGILLDSLSPWTGVC